MNSVDARRVCASIFVLALAAGVAIAIVIAT